MTTQNLLNVKFREGITALPFSLNRNLIFSIMNKIPFI
nr:MAG TPA: hypothetical protein [Caudoviricetes sp.]